MPLEKSNIGLALSNKPRHLGGCDVAIIGAGVVGCMIARELSKYELSVVVVEKEADVAAETSSANSGIVHAGFDAMTGTLKALLNIEGSRLMSKIAGELDVPYRQNGSLVLAYNQADCERLSLLIRQGETNGVEGLRILTKEELNKLEPSVSTAAISALYAPSGAIICPFQLTLGAAENAAENGVAIIRNWPVRRIRRLSDNPLWEADDHKLHLPTKEQLVGIGKCQTGAVEQAALNTLAYSSRNGFMLISDFWTLSAARVINAAGLHADDVAAMVGDFSFRIKPRKGEYLLLDKKAGKTVNATVFQTPGIMGKGILVTPTVDGNLLLGPNATEVPDKDDTETSELGLKKVSEGARRAIPTLGLKSVIRSFAGLRAASDSGDFVIRRSFEVDGFYHVAGIESPGLSSAPAIAAMVCRLLEKEGLYLLPKKDWKSSRKRIKRFSDMDEAERKEAVSKNPAYGSILCRCETVSEAEIIDAVAGAVGANCLDGLKRRTRAGMGRCQGGFCTPRVVEIMARELGISPDAVTKRGPGSDILSGPSKPEHFDSDERDQAIAELLLETAACGFMPPIPKPAELMYQPRLTVEGHGAKSSFYMPVEQINRQNPINYRLTARFGTSLSSFAKSIPESSPLVVIGSGPAGLAAAIEAKKSGVRDVIILEREKESGGILNQCIHPGFGIHLFSEELTGPEYAERFITEAAKHEIKVYHDTMVLNVTKDREITAVSGRHGYVQIRASAVIFAMGCRERAAGALSIPGARPAGIMTAGSAQHFINIEGYLPGRRIVILGSGDIGLIMARRLTLEGAKVEMVCEILAYAGGLTRNIVQCLEDFEIPLMLSHTVVALHGRRRLRAVTVAKVDEERNPIPGSEFIVPCDTLLLSVGLIPENELSETAGVLIDIKTGGPFVNMRMETSVPGIFACGNVVHVHDLVDHVSEEGRLAGRNAAVWLKAKGHVPGQRDIPVLAGEGIRYVLPASVSLEGVQPESRLLFRTEKPARNVKIEVSCGDVLLVSVKKSRVVPGEMEYIPIKREWLSKAALGSEITVRLRPLNPKEMPGDSASLGSGSTAILSCLTEEDCRKPEVNEMEIMPAVDSKKEKVGLSAIRCFALDLDGTFYLGDRLLTTSVGFLDKLRDLGLKYLFFTNNSSKSPEDYINKLAKMGVEIGREEIMTSGDVTISFLKNKRSGKTVFLLGTQSLRSQFEEEGLKLVEIADAREPSVGVAIADVVVVGFDTSLSYNALSQACWHIREGAEFIATHPDWNCPVQGGYVPDCGSMCALIEASTGKKPKFLGKPFFETMQAVIERTGAGPEEIAFVGDRLYTDVASGVNNGAQGILVLTGEAKASDIADSEVKPTWVFPSLEQLGEALCEGSTVTNRF